MFIKHSEKERRKTWASRAQKKPHKTHSQPSRCSEGLGFISRANFLTVEKGQTKEPWSVKRPDVHRRNWEEHRLVTTHYDRESVPRKMKLNDLHTLSNLNVIQSTWSPQDSWPLMEKNRLLQRWLNIWADCLKLDALNVALPSLLAKKTTSLVS